MKELKIAHFFKEKRFRKIVNPIKRWNINQLMTNLAKKCLWTKQINKVILTLWRVRLFL